MAWPGSTRTRQDDLSAAHDLAFRPTTAADLPALVALVQGAYHPEENHHGWTTATDLVGGPRAAEAMLRPYIERDGSQVVLAGPGSDLVGCGQG